jgi:multisubunit Na+/H+ antiporter MnhB subunit
MRRSLILDTTVRLVFDAVLVFSVYLLFAGHNQPGGGFVGGLVAAAGIALRYIAGGIADVRNLVPIRPWTFLSIGLGLAVGTAIVSMAGGGDPLDQRAVELTLPLLGDIKVTSATVFDSGVYLVVVGLVLMIFEALGEDGPATFQDGTEDGTEDGVVDGEPPAAAEEAVADRHTAAPEPGDRRP